MMYLPFIEIGNEFAAKAFGATLTIYHGKVMKKSDLLRIKVPENDDALNEFVEEIKKYDQGEYASIVENIIYQIDEIVGKCFGLSEDEIRYIQKEMKHDPYLKHIKPKLPFSGKKKRGCLQVWHLRIDTSKRKEDIRLSCKR